MNQAFSLVMEYLWVWYGLSTYLQSIRWQIVFIQSSALIRICVLEQSIDHDYDIYVCVCVFVGR